MKFSIVFIVLSFYLFSFSLVQAQSTASLEIPSRIDHSELSIWKIHPPPAYGTGFFISENLFITNFHIISPTLKNEDTTKNIFLSQEGNSSVLKVEEVLAASALYDLALLKTKEHVTHYLSLRKNPPEKEESLFLLGYPQKTFKKIKKIGDIFHEDSRFYIFPVNHSSSLFGASGSPVLDDKGQVVGVMSNASLNLLKVIKHNYLQRLITGNTGSDCSGFTSARICMEREIENLKELAKKGLPSAQYDLAYMYLIGQIIQQNFKTAFDWMQKAAQQGHIVAQEMLAVMYHTGQGIEKDSKLALYWMQQAAQQGSTSAQTRLALMYYGNEEIEQNLEMALYWLKQAIEKGHAFAQYKMAYMYHTGEGVEKNSKLTFVFTQESAKNGYPPAQYDLAIMYSTGQNIEKNPKLGFQWLKQAAKNNFLLAQYDLAKMYFTGQGIEKNPKLGFQWLEQAAKNGYPLAQYNLALMYRRGEGTDKNLELANYWMLQARKNGLLPTQYGWIHINDDSQAIK